jgi:WD40 repeat protein
MRFRDCVIVLAAFIVMNGIGSVRADEPVKEKATLKGHTEGVRCLTFSPNGKTLASGSADYSIKLWDVATGKNASLKMKDFSVYSLAFSPDGKTLASGDAGNRIHLWNLSSGKSTTLSDELRMAGDPMVVFSPDGKTLASGGRCSGELWDVATSKSRVTLKGFEEYGGDWPKTIAFAPDGKTLVSMGAYDGIRFWDVATGKYKAEQKIADKANFGAFSPDCKTLATANWDKINKEHIKLWDVATGKGKAILEGHEEMMRSLVFSPDGKTLASGSMDGTIKLWEVATGKETATLNACKSKEDRLDLPMAFSPDGKTLATGSDDNTIKLWDVSPRK